MGIRREEKRLRDIGVYVHIPFCARKCPYCDFNSVESPSPPERKYSECVLRELSQLIEKEGLSGAGLESVYLGGGTPSLFSAGAVARLISGITGRFTPFEDIEVTLEANPDTVTEEKLAGFRSAGVTRLSLGVQSLNDRELEALGRSHDARAAKEAFDSARRAGFENVGVDLIFGVPGQDQKSWEATLTEVIEMRPEHLSIYGLTLEEGTPMHEARTSGKIKLPADDETTEMYRSAIGLLKAAGYDHYEISNFSLPGLSSRHNMRYWQGGDYLGLGAGAHSYLDRPGWGRRWWNERKIERYMARVEETGSPEAGGEELKKEEAAAESMMLGLRTSVGVNAAAFTDRFGFPPHRALDFERFEKEGLIRYEGKGKNLSLTEKGMLFSNELFLSAVERACG
ncbi:MAG: radical SAM family heme chaperone HemW [Thermodesulfobacteriota bacterium]